MSLNIERALDDLKAAVEALKKRSDRDSSDKSVARENKKAIPKVDEAIEFDENGAAVNKSITNVRDGLTKLPDDCRVTKQTIAFMLDISMSALTPRGVKKESRLPLPPAVGTMTIKIGAPLKLHKDGKRDFTLEVWTVGQVKEYAAANAKYLSQRKRDRASKRSERLGPRASRSVTARLKREVKNISRRLQVLEAAQQAPIPTMTRTDGTVVGFCVLHTLNQSQVTREFQNGAQIEMLTLRDAVIEREWADGEEREPWAAAYSQLLETEQNRLTDRNKRERARTDKNSLEAVLKQAPEGPRKRMR